MTSTSCNKFLSLIQILQKQYGKLTRDLPGEFEVVLGLDFVWDVYSQVLYPQRRE